MGTPKKEGFGESPRADYNAGTHDSLLKERPRYERVKLGDGGRIVIPASMREAMSVKPGDDLILHVEDGELRVRSWLHNLKRIQAELSALRKPGESVVDEFLKERQEEQRRSDERFERLHAEGMAMKRASE